MIISKSQAIYLKAIYELSKEGELKVTKIADYLNYSKPSVIRALKTLDKLELIDYNLKIKLTKKGITYAKNLLKRDEVLNRFFVDVLKINKEQAKIDTENIKEYLSCSTVLKLEEYVCDVLNEKVENHNDFCICQFETCYTCNSDKKGDEL